MFFWNSCFFHDPVDVGNFISGSSAFSKTSLNIWKFTVHVLLKPGLQNFEHYFTSMWDECNLSAMTVGMSARTVGKANRGINVEKYDRFLKIKTIKRRKEKKNRKRKKENSTELQRPNIEAEVYNNNKMCDWIYTYTPISKIKTVKQK